MTVRQHPRLGPNYGRSSLRLATRLALARSGKLANQWTVPKHRCVHREQKRRVCCKRSDSTEKTGLINVSVQIPVEEGDSVESLSAKYNISASKLQKANGGQSEVTPGKELLVIQKVPENLMPTPQNKLVPLEAAYSDDEGEMALVKENQQIRGEQAQFVGVQAPDGAHLPRQVLGTARYVAGTALKIGLVLFAVSALWKLMHNLQLRNARSRLDDPDIRAELARRHGQSFLDHLDSEHAEAEAEEIYEAQNNARKAAEQHLRKQQAPAGAFTPRRPSDATGAAAASGSPSKSELEQQQRQQQQQQQAPTPALHKQQQQRQQQKHQQQQEQQPIQALHQPSRQREPVHSFASTPASSHAASGNSETSAPAPAGLTSGPSNSFNSTPNVLHAPSSTAVAAAKGLSVAGRLEADRAAGQSQRSQPSSLSHESTASNLAEDEAVFVHDSTVRESAPDSVDEASVPASASATSMTDSLDESPPDTTSIAVDTEAAEAAAVGDRAVPADGPTEDPADDLVTDVADDPVARECPWVDSELLFFVTDDEGYPLNTVLPTDEEAGIQQQQCFLAYEAEADMAAMMYKTAALLPEDLVAAGQYPLVLLDACIEENRPLAIVREGAAGGTEQVTDAKDWLQQLAASAQILFPDQMQQILLARLDKIEELEAEFASEAGTDKEAETEADLEADAEAGAMFAAASGMHADAAPRTSHVGSVNSHASDMAAGASSSRQQGGKPHDEREDAYAAMKKKQVIHLSKDSLNQFNQVSIQSPDSTSASQPSVTPRPSATGGSSQNGSHRHGAGSNNGDAWQSLSHVCVPCIEYLDGDLGFVTADMAEGNEVEQHILAFQARSDAEAVRYLVQSHLNELEAKVNVVPMASEQLQTRASELECHVTVYPSGQLQLKPGMTFEQLRQAAVAAR